MKVGQIVHWSYGRGMTTYTGVVMAVYPIDYPDVKIAASVIVTQSSNPSFIGETMGVFPADLTAEPFGKGFASKL